MVSDTLPRFTVWDLLLVAKRVLLASICLICWQRRMKEFKVELFQRKKKTGHNCWGTVVQAGSPPPPPSLGNIMMTGALPYLSHTNTCVPLSPFVSSLCSCWCLLPGWHFQSTRYPLTEYLLTFGWFDTFSGGKEFIINLHPISPLYLNRFTEEEKKKVARGNGIVRVSSTVPTSDVCLWEREKGERERGRERNPFWQVMRRNGTPAKLERAEVSWRVETLQLQLQIFSPSYQIFLSSLLYSSEGNVIFNESK